MAAQKLIDRFTQNQLINGRDGLYTRLTKRLPNRFGVPQAGHLILIRHSCLDSDLEAETQDSILEAHYFNSVSQALVGYTVGGATGEGIQIDARDMELRGLPRSYTKEFLTANVQWFCVDPDLDEAEQIIYDTDGKPQGGTLYKLIYLNDKPRDLLAWTLVLREFSDRVDPSTDYVTY